MITFTIEGLPPAPQGSKRHVGGGRMIESSAKVKPWREAIRQGALATGAPMTLEPVFVSLLFRFIRPKGHLNTKGQLKPSASVEHITRPDLDKLVRSTLDGLTGTLFKDDSQVAFLVASKEYSNPGQREGATIELRLIRDTPEPA
jgi:crossover junction endodeoxyribonuclease RusA